MPRAAQRLVAFLAAVGAALALAGTAGAAQVVVQLRPGVGRAALAASGARVVRAVPQLRAYLVDVPARAESRLVRLGTVSPNRRDRILDARAPAFAPSDPLVRYQWYLDRLEAPEAWDETLGDPGVVIAVIDTGIDYTHPELAGKVVLGPDIANGDDDPIDTNGHGTAVAGVAAAPADGQGIVGICPACTLLAIKVVKDKETTATKLDSATAIVWATDHGADVINLSIGSGTDDPVQASAVAYAVAHGVVVVSAAGNAPTDTPQFPASYPGVIAVAATTDHNRLWDHSAFGPWVDVAAPGVNLLSTALQQTYLRWTGTSFASPVVAGAAGLLLARVPGITAAQVTGALSTGTLPTPGASIRRLDLPRAVRRALGGPIEPDPPLTISFDPFAVQGEDYFVDGPPATAGTRFAVGAKVLRHDTFDHVKSGKVSCRARIGSVAPPLVQATFRRGIAKCVWLLPVSSGGRTVRGTLAVAVGEARAQQGFAVRIRPAAARGGRGR